MPILGVQFKNFQASAKRSVAFGYMSQIKMTVFNFHSLPET